MVERQAARHRADDGVVALHHRRLCVDRRGTAVRGQARGAFRIRRRLRLDVEGRAVAARLRAGKRRDLDDLLLRARRGPYSAICGVILLLLWFYMTGLLIVVGAE